MRVVLFSICLFFSCTLLSQSVVEPIKIPVQSERVIKVAFGSCNKHDREQPMWNSIFKTRPDLFIWAGDNIYGDTESMNELIAKYDAQLNVAEYQQFMARVNIIGTWDDHDYGSNDAGKEFPKKKESRDIALEFLKVPKTNPVWDREGMYQSYMLGNNDIKIILLDTRYFRDPLNKKGDDILPNEKGDILGEDQWAWLDHELRKNEGQKMTLIVSSIQVIPEEHPYEKWANFPKARKRLFELLHFADAPNVIFLSGDRHMAEISIMEYKEKNYYEITSSGLTHVWEDMPIEKNKYRRGAVIKELNFGFVSMEQKKDKYKYMLKIFDRNGRALQQLQVFLDD